MFRRDRVRVWLRDNESDEALIIRAGRKWSPCLRDDYDHGAKSLPLWPAPVYSEVFTEEKYLAVARFPILSCKILCKTACTSAAPSYPSQDVVAFCCSTQLKCKLKWVPLT